MPFDNTKYDVQLSGVGLRIENYRKSEAETFIPRLGSGTQTDSEFDLLRSRSLETFKGGQLQRDWKDDNAFFGSENLVPIYDDGVLYPVKSLQGITGTFGKSAIVAKAQTRDYLFVAVNFLNGPVFNAIYRIDTAGTVTSMTLPVAIANSVNRINSLVIWNNQLWGTQGVDSASAKMFYMAVTATTLIDITGGGAVCFARLAVFNGQLYGTGATADVDFNSNIFRYTGDTTNRSSTLVGTTGVQTNDYDASFFVFNGRLMLARADGLWAYDGIRVAPVDDQSSNVDYRNFRFPTVLKGYLYYWMYDGMYRFNGSMIEKMYDISEVGFPNDVTAGKNRLWIVYSNSAYTGSSRYDKSMGYDYSGGTAINGRVVIYDGKAMFTYSRTVNDGKPVSPDVSRQGENDAVAFFRDTIFVFTYYPKTNPGLYFKGDTNELAQTGTSAWRLITSIFDADFPMINKSIENLELVLDGDNPPSDEVISIEYRVTGFGGSSGWTALGSFKTQSQLQEYVFKQIPAGLKFKKIQFRFSGVTTLGYGFKRIVFRYLLVPDFKWQWNFSVNAFGDNPVEPLILRDMSSSAQKVSDIRGAIYSARATGVPVAFIDIDQFDLNGAHNNSVQTLNINTTSLLKPAGFVQIDDEIIRYTGKTSTTLTGCERGVLGSAAAAHNDNSAVFAFYRAVVRKLSNERIEMDDSDLDRQEDKSKPSQITLVLQEV